MIQTVGHFGTQKIFQTMKKKSKISKTTQKYKPSLNIHWKFVASSEPQIFFPNRSQTGLRSLGFGKPHRTLESSNSLKSYKISMDKSSFHRRKSQFLQTYLWKFFDFGGRNECKSKQRLHGGCSEWHQKRLMVLVQRASDCIHHIRCKLKITERGRADEDIVI